MIKMDVQTGHVLIVGIAVICGLFMLKVAKKIIGIAAVVIAIAVATKYFGLW